LPGLGLTTDVIVGFPGESERNFENTVRYIEGISFSGLHVFKFSPRRGTPAADFADQIEPGIKEQRSRRLIESGKKLAARFAWSLVGQELDVLVEQRAGEGDSLYEGLTGNYVRAIFPGREELRGEVVRVKMVETEGTTLKGFLC